MEYELTYADTVEEGAALAERIGRLEVRGKWKNLGFDTEFYNVRIGKESTVARAKVHFASLAWLEGGARLHPRGFYVPCAAVVSREVVTKCGPFRKLFSRKDLRWLAHNAPVDVHAMYNEGVDIVNVVNTLDLARYVFPGRARAQYGGGGFTLGALGEAFLGEGKTDDFRDIFTERVEEYRVKLHTWKECECGALGCRKRSAGHSKLTRQEEVREPFWVEREIPLQDVVPGHPLFNRALRYAAQDAVLAHCLAQLLYRELSKQERLVPWIPVKLVTEANLTTP